MEKHSYRLDHLARMELPRIESDYIETLTD